MENKWNNIYYQTGTVSIGQEAGTETLDVFGTFAVSQASTLNALSVTASANINSLTIQDTTTFNGNVYLGVNSAIYSGDEEFKPSPWDTGADSQILTNPYIYYTSRVNIGSSESTNYTLNVDGTFNVDSLSTLHSVSISNASTINIVNANTIISDSSTIYNLNVGSATTTGVLDVLGSTSISENLNVTNITNLNSTLNVQGTTNLSDNLFINDTTSLNVEINTLTPTRNLDMSSTGTIGFGNNYQLTEGSGILEFWYFIWIV